MPMHDSTAWMWAEACQMLDEAERLHQQFFGRVTASQRIAWQPPADVFEDEHQVLVVVALPGVPPECIKVVIDGNRLTISADCEMPIPGSRCAIRRMEIPHGYFERRIDLPAVHLALGEPQSRYGCLILTLRKTG